MNETTKQRIREALKPLNPQEKIAVIHQAKLTLLQGMNEPKPCSLQLSPTRPYQKR